MPHATPQSMSFTEFVKTHRAQLDKCAIPERYWCTLYNKLKDEVSQHTQPVIGKGLLPKDAKLSIIAQHSSWHLSSEGRHETCFVQQCYRPM